MPAEIDKSVDIFRSARSKAPSTTEMEPSYRLRDLNTNDALYSRKGSTNSVIERNRDEELWALFGQRRVWPRLAEIRPVNGSLGSSFGVDVAFAF